MKILFCNYEYPPIGGGGGVINAALAEELAQRHEVTVLTSRGLGLPPEEVSNRVRIIRVPVLFRRRQAAANLPSLLAFIPSAIKAGRALLQRESFDVINTHFALPSGPVGQFLSNYASIPNVLSVHGGDLYDPSKWMSPHKHYILRAWIRHLLVRADYVVGQSNNTLENMRRYYSADVRTALIPLGISRPSVVTGAREDYGLPADATILVTIGRLVARKAVDQLVDSMAILKSSGASLIVIGSGPEEEALKDKIVSLGLENCVHLLGQVNEVDKVKLLGLSDIYVSTSQHEGFGLVFLEAMAQGLPIVCYDFGGQTDFLDDGLTGGVIELNNIDNFVRATVELIEGSERRCAIGKENIKRVEDFYIDTCAARYEQVFNEVRKAGRATNTSI